MNRMEFVFLFDVRDGNPNGDPDAGNLPRLDAETGQGLVTDVCLKRKIRNFVALTRGEKPPYEIYVKEKAVLNQQHEKAYLAASLKSESKKLPKDVQKAKDLTTWMCKNFFDIRSFGAVMTTEVNCGQVRGPIQMGMARSIDPIVSSEHSITRCAVTTVRESEEQDGGNRTMGRKFTVPYGLYRVHGFINPHLAEQTGFSEDDLQLLWSALLQMFDLDRSATRGEMGACKLIVFEHETPLGNAPARVLFDAVTVELTPEVKADSRPPRSFKDYVVDIKHDAIPAGVKVDVKL